MFPSRSPYADADAYMAAQEAALNARPVCCLCGEHIQDEYAYRIDNDLYCKDCMDDMRVNVDDMMELEGLRYDALRD